MSATAARESRRVRSLCHQCQVRRALFQYRGGGHADRHHTLCFECYRSAREQMRATQLAARMAGLEIVPMPAAQRGALTPRQAEHRERMLAHLVR